LGFGISFLLFLGGGCTPPPVSTGSVQGVVTDNQSSEPLAGALISAGNVSTTSNISGNYILSKIPVGDREVTAVIEGYSSQTKTVEIIENEITELDFQLTPLSQENQRVVMVELYMAAGCPSCEVVKPILEQLVDEYGYEQLVLVEEAGWGDYSTTEISNRYKWYFPDSADRSVPNILFNGLNDRIHGSSNYSTLKNKIDVELAKAAKIVITIDSRNSDTNTTTISGIIENISDSTLSNLEINGMIFKERPTANLKYSVTDIFDEQKVEITSLAPEEILDFSFILEGINWGGDNIHGVIFVQAPNSSTKEILQAAFIE
jgi:thiol-disulfide isomerase/thioredoxin